MRAGDLRSLRPELLLRQLAHLVGDHREARLSPARAASMAAFRASRLVWSAMVEIVSTMPPMRSLRLVRPSITWRQVGRGVGQRPHRCGGFPGGFDALVGDAAGLCRGLGGLGGGGAGLLDHTGLALGTGGDVADGVCDLLDRASGLIGRGRHLLGSAREASRRHRDLREDGRDVLGHAVERDAERVALRPGLDRLREVAVGDPLSSPTISRRYACMRTNALPRASFSDFGCTENETSPWLIDPRP